jgi:hypothetical protein
MVSHCLANPIRGIYRVSQIAAGETLMDKQFLKYMLGWGIVLWLVGYVLGIIFFFVFPPSLIGWVIMPIGIALIFWILLKKVKGVNAQGYLMLAIAWTIISIAFDYLFIVKTFKPIDGYYKLDVYLYYALTFMIPLIVGWWKITKSNE